MLAFDQDTWTTEQEIPTQLRRNAGADELERNRISRAAAPDPEDEDYDEDDDLDLDDDDLDYDDDEEDLDNDVEPGYDEDLDEDDDDLDDPIRAEIDDNDELTDDDAFAEQTTSYDPDDVPGREEAADEKLGAPNEQEVRTPQEGNDASYSEQTDVTPPRQHEFPSEGSPKTDFTSRNQGRTTGRMVGHEPGTEGI
jgi:hypothetical protein